MTVLEASDQVGGKLATGTVAGVEVDLGAESVLARRPEAVDLVDALGLDAGHAADHEPRTSGPGERCTRCPPGRCSGSRPTWPPCARRGC